MLTTEENDLLTRTGPGTPAGELLRRYWQPAALAEEIPPGGAPVPLRLLGEDLCQGVEPLLQMDYGLKVCKVREMGPERHFYLGTYVIPSAFAFSGNVREAGYSLNWHVPIDDTHHWKFTFIHSTSQALDKDSTRRGRLSMTPDYRPLRNRGNRFQQDRSTMDQSYTGIGNVFQAHDLCVTEGAGPIQDRTQEHLAGADAPLVVARKLLMKGIKDIQEGLDPPNVIRDPTRNHFPQVFACATTVPAETDWRAFFRQLEAERVSERQPATAR